MRLSYLKNGSLHTETVEAPCFKKSVDILVVGLGASGCYAAVAAAREGATVLGVERDSGIGGMPINGGVTFFYYGERGGTYENVDVSANKIDKAVFAPKGKQPESRRAALHRLLCEHGVEYMTDASVIGLYLDEKRVTGVRIYEKGSVISIACEMLIDATSDGHIVRMCPDVKTHLGRVSDGKTVPFTNRSLAINEAGGLAHYNGDDGYCNQYDPHSFSLRVLAAHASKLSTVSGGEQRFISLATTPGVREGIRFEGEEHLSYLDIISAKDPEKILFFARSDLDKHGHDHAMDDGEYKKWWVVSNLATVVARIPVPLGAVVPKGIWGLVTAGRCLSVDSYASSAVRMNADMFRLGECVGIAAAMAVRDKCRLNEINYDEYVGACKKYGCREGIYADRFAFDHPSKKEGFYEAVDFNMSPKKIQELLATDAPGVAIWSAHVSEDDLDDMLVSNLDSENAYLSFNSAVALGIRGNAKCLPVLRNAVKNRNFERFAGCRRSNQFKSAVAICLIGELGDASDIELLLPIIDERELDSRAYREAFGNVGNEESEKTAREAYYQMLTHAAVAVKSIAERTGNASVSREALKALLDPKRSEKIIDTVTRGKPASSLGVEIKDFLTNISR